MSLLEKYKWFQTGIVKAGVNVKLQKFFKTNPTEEQLMLLDEMDKVNEAIWWGIIILYFVLGIAIGYALTQMQIAINALVGG